MGRRAADMLIDIAVHNKPVRAMTFKIDGPLIERASVAARKNPAQMPLRPAKQASSPP